MNSTKLIKLKKKALEKILQKIPLHPEPKAYLEQYSTPAYIAADALFLAYPDIIGSKVVDLGCGTGIFAIGAKLLGAKECIGVDKDEKAIAVAEQFCKSLNLKRIKFKVCRVRDFKKNCDVVIQNPPFGAQKKHADRVFIKKALELAPIVYSFHLSRTKNFVKSFVESLNAVITFEKIYKLPIKYMFKFHRKERLEFEVSLFRFERANDKR
jgi:putative methylase